MIVVRLPLFSERRCVLVSERGGSGFHFQVRVDVCPSHPDPPRLSASIYPRRCHLLGRVADLFQLKCRVLVHLMSPRYFNTMIFFIQHHVHTFLEY